MMERSWVTDKVYADFLYENGKMSECEHCNLFNENEFGQIFRLEIFSQFPPREKKQHDICAKKILGMGKGMF